MIALITSSSLQASEVQNFLPEPLQHLHSGRMLGQKQQLCCQWVAKGHVLSDIKLVSSQVVHKRLDEEVSREVEDQAKGDGDGQRWQSLLKDGQQQQRQTQTLRQLNIIGESATGQTTSEGFKPS